MNMNDEENSTIYDTVQKERMYELPDQPEEDEGPLYDNIHEGLWENHVYATELETHDYDSVSVYVAGGEEENLTSSQPEAADYLLPDEVCPESQDLQPAERQEDRDISVEELHSPTPDWKPGPEEPQEDGGMMGEDLLSPRNFTIQQSRTFFTSNSAANGLEENERTSTDPEISLFVKVRAVSERHPCMGGRPNWGLLSLCVSRERCRMSRSLDLKTYSRVGLVNELMSMRFTSY
ncbi:chloride intracellular channel protein 5-like isoform X2 [Ursus maritimus]|nr:chloride intracellular channel protein 5-like isoform X2 [Ursus maritimus]